MTWVADVHWKFLVSIKFYLWFMIFYDYRNRNDNKILLQSSSSTIYLLSYQLYSIKTTIYIPCILSQPQQSLFPVARPQLDKSWTIKQLSKSWNYRLNERSIWSLRTHSQFIVVFGCGWYGLRIFLLLFSFVIYGSL